MGARYQLREIGVYDTVLEKVIHRNDVEWPEYREWLRTNTPDPMPVVTVAKTQEEIDAEAELAAQKTLKDTLRVDAAVRGLATRSPAQVDNWIDSNVTNLSQARDVLKIACRVLAYLIRTHLPPKPVTAAPPPGPIPPGV